MKKTILILSCVIGLLIVLTGFTAYINIPKIQPIREITTDIIYLDKECEPTYCNPEQVQYFVDDLSTSDNIIAIVKGSLYEKGDNITVFGSCLNSSSHPIDTNASLNIYYPNATIWLLNQSMDIISTGKFFFNNITPDTKGTYLIEFNCSDAVGDWAVDYGEFQNSPSWIDKISSMFTNIQSLVSTQHTEFKISRLDTGNPKYANDSIVVEVGFTNGTIVSPEEINLSVYYPNNTLWFEATKTDFIERSNHIWRYNDTKVPIGSPVGMYSVNLWANNTVGLETVEAIQFMIRSGGPYSVELDCPSSVSAGSSLVCTVTLLDEGSTPVESLNEVWVDTNGDKIEDVTEPQSSFSKQTSPGERVVRTVSINIPQSHPTGFFIVRLETSYAGDRDISKASDGVTITPFIPLVIPAVTNDGGGTYGDSATNCDDYSQFHKTCYTLNSSANLCILGCPEGLRCNKEFKCVVTIERLPDIAIGFFDSLWRFIRSIFGTTTLTIVDDTTGESMELKITPSSEWDNVKDNFKDNPMIKWYIIGGIVALLLLFQFGIIQRVFNFIIANWQWSLVAIVFIVTFWYLKTKGLM